MKKFISMAALLLIASMCPVCGRMMVLRIHRNGSDKGKKFYGCMDSPKCNGVVEIG